MRRWKVVIYNLETGEHSRADRFFRHSAAQRCADPLNARFTLRPDEDCFRAMVVDERFERRVLRQRRLGSLHCRL